MGYQYQPFPKCVYRGTVESFETRTVRDEDELAAAQAEGFGEHPAHRKTEVVNAGSRVGKSSGPSFEDEDDETPPPFERRGPGRPRKN